MLFVPSIYLYNRNLETVQFQQQHSIIIQYQSDLLAQYRIPKRVDGAH